MKKEELYQWVREELVFKRLKLADMGVALDEIQSETPLFDDSGLDLDSIDGLELAVGIEQKFGIKIGKLTEDIARNRFKNLFSITDFIIELQQVTA
ncbi:MAG: phosphopantetheine-binding protein [Nitrospirota bacterium]